MAIAGLTPNVWVLGASRVFTGIGIGGLLAAAATTATSSDYCNNKNRSLAVTLVAGGFAFGVYLGATFLAPLLKQYDWRVTFYLGAVMSFIFIPLVYVLVPETVSFLERKRPTGALELIQKIMCRLGHTAPETLASMKQIGFFTGTFVFAAIAGFFGLFATSFPSSLLGSGSGLILGIGRGGAVLGPMIPGFLFAAGVPLTNVALLMAAGSFLAGITVIFLHQQRAR